MSPEPKKRKVDTSMIDIERRHWENDKARRTFLEAHWGEMPIENLRCLSQVFINVNVIGCEYNPTLMDKIRTLGAGIMERARRLQNEAAFVKASVGRAHASEIREKDELERRPTIEQRKAQRTPFEEKLVQLRAVLQVSDVRQNALQTLNTACGRQQISWQFMDKADGAELRLSDHLICKHKFTATDVDKKEEIVAAVVEALREGGEFSVVGDDVYMVPVGSATEMQSPYDCYEHATTKRLARVYRQLVSMHTTVPSMTQLENAMSIAGLKMRHSLERLEGWEQQLLVRCGDIILAQRVLKKAECVAPRVNQIISEVAKQITNSLLKAELIKDEYGNLSLVLKT